MAGSADREKLKKVEYLLRAIENVYPSTKEMVWKSFLRGLFFGLGSTIGVSIILAFLAYIAGELRSTPILQDFLSGFLSE